MTLEKIKEAVEVITQQQLNRESRERELVYARAIYFKVAKKYTKHSLKKIGAIVNRHHASVIHGLNLFENVIVRYEAEALEDYNKIIRMLLKNNIGIISNPEEYYRNKLKETLLDLRQERNNNRSLRKELLKTERELETLLDEV